MKALIYKDICVLWKQMRIFVVVILFILLVNGWFGTVFLVLWATMLPYTAMAYDERSKWDQLAAMMPYSTRDLVLSKYMLGWLCAGAAGTLSLLFQLASRLLRLPLDTGTPEIVLAGVCLSACILGVTLPMFIRFGAEKGRMGMILIVFLVSGGSAALSDASFHGGAGALLPGASVLLLPGAALAVTAVSLPLSIKLYRQAHGGAR